MTKPLTYLTSAGLASAVMQMTHGTSLLAAGQTPTTRLIERPLGKTGVTLPIVSMGVMNAEAPGLIVRSYEVGIRHFDTAAVYQGGRNEEMLGNVIRQLGVRDKVIISTKAPVRDPGKRDPADTKADTLKSLEGSLKRLQMDHVEIFYLHEPSTALAADDPGVQEAMVQLKKEGRIRYAGVSTHSGQTEVLNAVARGGFYEVVLVGYNYTMSGDQAMLEAMRLCAAKGVGLIAMKTQAGGDKPRRLESFGNEKQKSVRQSAVLKWVLQHPFITTAVPGFTRFEHIDEDMPAAYDLALNSDERDFLSNNAMKASLEFCQQCGSCLASCPNRVDVPRLMRSHMYVFQYENLDQARYTLAQIPAGAGLEVCRSCAACSAVCSHTVNIKRKVQELSGYQGASLLS